MYSNFDQISFVGMSNSEYLFIEKGPEESIEFDFRLEFSDENHITVATNNDCIIHQHEDKEEEHGVRTDEVVKKEEVECVSYNKDDDSFLKKELKIQSLGECEQVDENDDGFRTPTSLEHKIPVIQQCPPAPKKPKAILSTKRKASSNVHRVRIDLSKEMDMLFPIPQALLVDLGCKIKKAKGNNTK